MHKQLLDRRTFLSQSQFGLAGIALTSLLDTENLLAKGSVEFDPTEPFRARKPHFKARAKNVIVIFCAGAVSHVDFWEHKPELIKQHGKPLPSNGRLISFQGENGNLQKPLWDFVPRGECGKKLSKIVPHIGSCVDDICFLHAVHTKSSTHGPGENLMSTGFNREGYPGIGAWISYGLGTENQNLPAFVAIEDPRGTPQSGPNNWTSGFLPASFQGTAFSTTKPIRHLTSPDGILGANSQASLAMLKSLNELHQKNFQTDTALSARISSYELAAKLQLSIPDATDVSLEPKHTLELYGADAKDQVKSDFAKNCILARRLVEKGVRFVQLFNGAYASGGTINWDTHNNMPGLVPGHADVLDQPVAGLIKDLRQRDLLKDTLIVCCTEFGRMPMFQVGNDGRDHNPEGFTIWLAGGGVKGGTSYGSTDPFGYKAETNRLSIHDVHATILHLLGLDHTRLTYYHNGLQRRLTDVHGHVVKEIIS